VAASTPRPQQSARSVVGHRYRRTTDFSAGDGDRERVDADRIRHSESHNGRSRQRRKRSCDGGARVGVVDNRSIEETLDTTGDEHARAVLAAISRKSRSAKELAEECDLSLPTVYRRIET